MPTPAGRRRACLTTSKRSLPPTGRTSTGRLPRVPSMASTVPGVEPSEAIIENWWREGMMGGAKAHYDGIVAFSQTDFTEDLKKITVPVLVMHGEDDQIVPYADAGPLSAELLQNGTLKTYEGFPHGMTDHAGRNDQRRPTGIPAVLSDWTRRPALLNQSRGDSLACVRDHGQRSSRTGARRWSPRAGR